MSRVDRRKRFELTEATPVEQRPQIWVDGRQQPKFKIGPYVSVSLAIAKRDLLPDMLATETRLRGFGDRVRQGEVRPNLAWAGRFAHAVPHHETVAGWITTVADVYSGARARLEGRPDSPSAEDEGIAYPDLIRPAAPARPVKPRRAAEVISAPVRSTTEPTEAEVAPAMPEAAPPQSLAEPPRPAPERPLFPEPEFLAAALTETAASLSRGEALLGRAPKAAEAAATPAGDSEGQAAALAAKQAHQPAPESEPAKAQALAAEAPDDLTAFVPLGFEDEFDAAFQPASVPIPPAQPGAAGLTPQLSADSPVPAYELETAFAAGLAWDGAALVDPLAPPPAPVDSPAVAEVQGADLSAPAQGHPAPMACSDGLDDMDDAILVAGEEPANPQREDTAALSVEAAIRGLFAELHQDEAALAPAVPLAPEPVETADPDLSAIRLAIGGLQPVEAEAPAPVQDVPTQPEKPAVKVRFDPNQLDEEALAKEKTALARMLSGFEELHDPEAEAEAGGPWGATRRDLPAPTQYSVPARRPSAVVRMGGSLVRGSGRAARATGRGLGAAGLVTARGAMALLRGTAAALLPVARPLGHWAGKAAFSTAAWTLAGLMLAFATPGGAVKAMIYHLDGGDLSDWS